MKVLNNNYRFVSAFDNEFIPRVNIDYSYASSGAYVVDDSHFVPLSEAVKQLGCNNDYANTNLAYDFNDGKDDGSKIPISRKKSVTLAEISTELNSVNDSIKETVEKNQIFEQKIASFEKGLESSSSSGEK